MPKTTEKPCKQYLKGEPCKNPEGREHCFNCARHLDEYAEHCPHGCGEHGEKNDDDARNY